MTAGDFQGKRVVVTGGAGLHGRWISEAFAREGAVLLLVDLREEPLREAVDVCRREGAGEVSSHLCDLRDPAAVQGLVDLVAETWGAPDVLVNNAGMYPRIPFLDLTVADWNALMELNVRAPFLLSQGMARLMITHQVEGAIVNLSSGAARRARSGQAHYASSKAAIEALTRSCAIELAPHGIRVNAVSPGFATHRAADAPISDDLAAMWQSIPLGRESGPHDASEAVLFVSSSKASYITGTTIVVDGGRAAGQFKGQPTPGT